MTKTSPRRWVMVLILMAVSWAVLIVSSPSPAYAQRVGTVSVVDGSATIGGRRARVGAAVNRGDLVKTARGGKVRIVFADQSIISVGSGSSLTINEYVYNPSTQRRRSRMRLLFGKVKAFVNRLSGGSDFNVTTSTAVIGVRGTVFIVWAVSDQVTRVAVFQDSVEVQSFYNPSESVLLSPNTMTSVRKMGGPSAAAGITPQDTRDFNQGIMSSDTGVDRPSSEGFVPPPTSPGDTLPGGPGPGDGGTATTLRTFAPTTSTSTTTSTTTTTTLTNPVILELPGFPGHPN